VVLHLYILVFNLFVMALFLFFDLELWKLKSNFSLYPLQFKMYWK